MRTLHTPSRDTPRQDGRASRRAPKPDTTAGVIESVDARPEAIVQRQLQTVIQRSPRVQRVAQLRHLVDTSPRRLEQRERLSTLAATVDGASSRAARSRASTTQPVVQRLIVNAGEATLMDEAAKPSGWITMKTLDVGFAMDPGAAVVELAQIGGLKPIGTNEDIHIVGHGASGEVAAAKPDVLADHLRPILPKPWNGLILGLTCNAGLAESADKTSGGQQLHEALGGAPVIAARGSTFTHMSIDKAIRVLKEDKTYADDFRRYYLRQIPFTSIEQRALLIEMYPADDDLKTLSDREIDAEFGSLRGQIDTGSDLFLKIIATKDTGHLLGRDKESREIDVKHGEVNKAWLTYMSTAPTDLVAMARKATALSADFYKVAVAYGDRHNLFHTVGSDEEFEYHA